MVMKSIQRLLPCIPLTIKIETHAAFKEAQSLVLKTQIGSEPHWVLPYTTAEEAPLLGSSSLLGGTRGRLRDPDNLRIASPDSPTPSPALAHQECFSYTILQQPSQSCLLLRVNSREHTPYMLRDHSEPSCCLHSVALPFICAHPWCRHLLTMSYFQALHILSHVMCHPSSLSPLPVSIVRCFYFIFPFSTPVTPLFWALIIKRWIAWWNPCSHTI